MAVHVPLTPEAQTECWTLLLSSKNLLNPASGHPIAVPTQDMVLGINYLTRERKGAHGEGRHFSTPDECILSVDARGVDYQAAVKVKMDGVWVDTTPGRVIMNDNIPNDLGFLNYAMGEKELLNLIAKCYKDKGPAITVKMLDAVKDLGFKYATRFGATIGMDDIVVPAAKKALIKEANSQVDEIQRQYLQGHITNEERYNRVIEVWSSTNELITNELMDELKRDNDGFNPVYMMANSGARGSRSQIRQLAGMRGLMAKPSGDIIELPIRSNFKEGLSVIEFFISTNGARKGLADTALKTADAGYLTRRLVDIAQDVVISEEDCGTINGIERRAIKDGEDIVEHLHDRISGRYSLEKVKHPITGELIVDVNQEIDDEIAQAIEDAGIEGVRIRSVLTCDSKYGVCGFCYGRNLATYKSIEIGEAVGIIAAQSIGQPGTQLTMRTFHIGGAATKISEENRIYLKYPVLVEKIQGSMVTVDNGNMLFTRKGTITVRRILANYELQKGDKVLVKDGQRMLKHGPEAVIQRKGETISSSEICYVKLTSTRLLLIAQPQIIEIRNGAEIISKEGDVVPGEETIASTRASHSATKGLISFSQKRVTVSASWRCSGVSFMVLSLSRVARHRRCCSSRCQRRREPLQWSR